MGLFAGFLLHFIGLCGSFYELPHCLSHYSLENTLKSHNMIFKFILFDVYVIDHNIYCIYYKLKRND